jgi:hypothetical protein
MIINTITDKGNALLTKHIGNVGDLHFTRVMIGTGALPDVPEAALDLTQPYAPATSTPPVIFSDHVRLALEYLSILNGGQAEDILVSELGLYAMDPDEGEILFFYCHFDPGRPVESYLGPGSAIDGLRVLVVFMLSGLGSIVIEYPMDSYMTADEIIEWSRSDLIPVLSADLEGLITVHNADPDAHEGLQTKVNANANAIAELLNKMNNDVGGNSWNAWFDNLDDLDVSGIWNSGAQRLEF